MSDDLHSKLECEAGMAAVRHQSMTLRCAVCQAIVGSISNQVAHAKGVLAETAWQIAPCQSCLDKLEKRVREELDQELAHAKRWSEMADTRAEEYRAEAARYRAALRSSAKITQILTSRDD